MTDTTDQRTEHPPKLVAISVNNKVVEVPEETTGAGIKNAAGIPPNFQLFEIRGHEEHEIGNDQQIRVHEGERFVATPPIEPA